jgi:pimeloyl-ACP methyl ester carboxylesterase
MRLAYDDVGSGDCVVLIHGHPFDRILWEPQLPGLRDGFRVIAPDLRGFGESPVKPGVVRMREYAADIEGLLDELRVGRTAVVGLTMGGLVTMELAGAQPQRYWAIGLVATTAGAGDSAGEPHPAPACRCGRAGRDGRPRGQPAVQRCPARVPADLLARPAAGSGLTRDPLVQPRMS